MLSRVSYALRETWQGFQRNWTLTAASVLTAAVSLLLAGMSFFIQKSFDQVLHQWSNNVQFVIFMKPDASPDQIAAVKSALDDQKASGVVRDAPYSGKADAYSESSMCARPPITSRSSASSRASSDGSRPGSGSCCSLRPWA